MTYAEHQVVGRGGFAVVTRVVDDEGRQVARKTFSPKSELSKEDPEFRRHHRRFLQEARLLQDISHPNVVRVLTSQLGVDPPHYDMPLASRSLRQQIMRDRASEQANLLPIIDVLAGLEALHSQSLIHGDLKPENILLVDSEWQVADLGLASFYGATGGAVTSGRIVGSDFYAAPERLQSRYAAGVRSDIYSVGCILHDILGFGEPRESFKSCSVPGPYGPVVSEATEADEDIRTESVWALRDAIGEATSMPNVRDLPINLIEVAMLVRERAGRLTRSEVALLTDALGPAQQSSVGAQLLYSLSERALGQIEADHPLHWRRIGLAACRISRELAGGLRTIDADRLVARLVYFGGFGDDGLNAATTIALLSVADGSGRGSSAWWAARNLTKEKSGLVERILPTLHRDARLWRRGPRLGTIIAQAAGGRLDPRVRSFFEDLQVSAGSVA